MGFALLSRLRYLNLKNNSFSVFPEVVRASWFQLFTRLSSLWDAVDCDALTGYFGHQS
jgi:hypothetical protein